MVLLELTGDQGIGTGCQNLIDRTLPGACKDGNFFGLSHSVFHGVIPIGKQIVEPLTQFVPVVGTGGKQPDMDSLERQKSSTGLQTQFVCQNGVVANFCMTV